MRGFDNRFADFPDYILGITKEIWEDRGLGARMKEYYHPEVIVRMPGGISFGEASSTAATMSTLVEFPDRVLLGEDVIWSADDHVAPLVRGETEVFGQRHRPGSVWYRRAHQPATVAEPDGSLRRQS